MQSGTWAISFNLLAVLPVLTADQLAWCSRRTDNASCWPRLTRHARWPSLSAESASQPSTTTAAATNITRGCGRWGAARYGAVLAVEYGQTEGTAVAMVTRSPGARRRGFLMTPAKYITYIRESTNQHLEILIIRLTLTQLLCPVTLTFDSLTLKLVHGVLVSR